jgi:uncharacterized protein YyaL (SSP411 family)
VRDQARRQLAAAFDPAHGGFGGAPKFAHPSDLLYLLRRGRDEGDAHALHMALFSLRKMAEGGLYDQIGGGFFRFSVDSAWGIPHFEKMLVDNAVLLVLYAEAWAVSGEPLFRRVLEDTAGWALREMAAASGGFVTSLAADDARCREGEHYVWESEPLRLALSPNGWDVAPRGAWSTAPTETGPGGCGWHGRPRRWPTTLGRRSHRRRADRLRRASSCWPSATSAARRRATSSS